MEAAFCPARLGHWGLDLLPLGPWQARQAAALAAPAVAEPAAMASGAVQMVSSKPAQRIIGIIYSRLPSDGRIFLCRASGSKNCTLATRRACLADDRPACRS